MTPDDEKRLREFEATLKIVSLYFPPKLRGEIPWLIQRIRELDKWEAEQAAEIRRLHDGMSIAGCDCEFCDDRKEARG